MDINKSRIEYCLLITFFITLLGSPTKQLLGEDGSGLKTSVAVDLVGDFKVNKESSAPDRIDVRSAEVSFYAPIDHLFDGVMSFAAHREKGVSLFEVHEATIGSDRIIPYSQFKIGQFFLGIGRLNQFHQHDWAFTTTPLVHQAYLGKEGVIDTGAEYRILLPLPFYLDLTIGLTSGYVFGHSHNEGKKPLTPTHYLRTVNFFNLFSLDTQLGVSYLNRISAEKESTRLVGLDLTVKKKNGRELTFLLQSETWFRQLEFEGAEEEKGLGSYLYPQIGLNPEWLLGMRFDYLTVLNKTDARGKSLSNYELGVIPTITYKPSEFSKLRLSYNFVSKTMKGIDDKIDHSITLQSAFILGAHPAHNF